MEGQIKCGTMCSHYTVHKKNHYEHTQAHTHNTVLY
jgi:hypothetical protein